MNKLLLFSLFFLLLFNVNAQKITISGTISQTETNEKLEYATIILAPKNKGKITGGVTDIKGEFSVEINPGLYDVVIEYLSLETKTILDQNFIKDTNLGMIQLNPTAEALDEVEIIAEKSTVEIRLDKKIYNVGKDMTVKGGSASDVLDNVPAVTVDVEGAISLRGNENVRILINGKPSGLAGGAEALKQLPADVIQKVEVITSPSARYDAEGTAGIINIVLRKGKVLGFNGTLNLNATNPTGYGASTTLNYRTKKFNLFSNLGYSYNDAPGNAYFLNEFFDDRENPFQIENRLYDRERKNLSANFGMEYFISDYSSITGSVSFQNSKRETLTTVDLDLENLSNEIQESSLRSELENDEDKQFRFDLNYTKTFNESSDHKLTLDFRHETNSENEYGDITDEETFPVAISNLGEKTINLEDEKVYLFQGDYVLPLGEKSQFEAGFRSNLTNRTIDYQLSEEQTNGEYEVNTNVSNVFEYGEKIHALYTQYGNKFGKFSALAGLRMEISDIDVDVSGTNLNFNKKYTEFFPTANLAYEINEDESFTLGYNRRIRRPRSRHINPFVSIASETNVFKGNPDLDPTYSNAVDISYLKKWDKLTFSTSVYYNYATDVFDFISIPLTTYLEDYPEESNLFDFISDPESTVIRRPQNIASDQRFGFEFSVNYNPYKWWKLNNSFNFFNSKRDGNGVVDDSESTSWFTRFNSRVTLPKGIEWQTTLNYRGPYETFQSKRKGIATVNLAFSKDILKEKATLSLNVSDLFNSRKRITDTYIEDYSNSYSEFQWRERQIRLNFTYRFNQKKKRTRERGGSNDFEGGEDGGF